MAEQPPQPTYRVVAEKVENWKKGDTFTLADYAKAHPLPEGSPPSPGYHDALVRRLIAAGQVRQEGSPAGPLNELLTNFVAAHPSARPKVFEPVNEGIPAPVKPTAAAAHLPHELPPPSQK